MTTPDKPPQMEPPKHLHGSSLGGRKPVLSLEEAREAWNTYRERIDSLATSEKAFQDLAASVKKGNVEFVTGAEAGFANDFIKETKTAGAFPEGASRILSSGQIPDGYKVGEKPTQLAR